MNSAEAVSFETPVWIVSWRASRAATILIVFPWVTVVNPFACSTERKTSYASSSVTRRGEMIVIFPWTRSSKMKFFFVCSLMNLMRTGSSTSVKSIDMYTGGGAGGGGGGGEG